MVYTRDGGLSLDFAATFKVQWPITTSYDRPTTDDDNR